jgi:hypothetical protein
LETDHRFSLGWPVNSFGSLLKIELDAPDKLQTFASKPLAHWFEERPLASDRSQCAISLTERYPCEAVLQQVEIEFFRSCGRLNAP